MEIDIDKIRHEFGKGKILNKMEKKLGKIGLIDEYPSSSQPRKLSNYELINTSGGLKLFKHFSDNIHLIQIEYRLENWLLKRSSISNIDITSYGFPNNEEELHKISRIDLNAKFHTFLKRLIEIDEEIRVLKEWITQYS